MIKTVDLLPLVYYIYIDGSKERRKEKKIVGRPPLNRETKTIKITVMLNEKEHQLLQRVAEEKGLSMSEYLRKKIPKK